MLRYNLLGPTVQKKVVIYYQKTKQAEQGRQENTNKGVQGKMGMAGLIMAEASQMPMQTRT